MMVIGNDSSGFFILFIPPQVWNLNGLVAIDIGSHSIRETLCLATTAKFIIKISRVYFHIYLKGLSRMPTPPHQDPEFA